MSRARIVPLARPDHNDLQGAVMARFDPTMPEEWYPIPELSGYEISSRLRVRSNRMFRRPGDRWRELSVKAISKGYLGFGATVDGRPRRAYIHHVVALLSIGPRPDGMQVLHKDDNPRNNDPGNLYYGTPRQNAQDRMRNGRTTRGERSVGALLTTDQVREIHRRGEEGERGVDLAIEFGVGRCTVYSILNGRNWKHVTGGIRVGGYL